MLSHMHTWGYLTPYPADIPGNKPPLRQTLLDYYSARQAVVCSDQHTPWLNSLPDEIERLQEEALLC